MAGVVSWRDITQHIPGMSRLGRTTTPVYGARSIYPAPPTCCTLLSSFLSLAAALLHARTMPAPFSLRARVHVSLRRAFAPRMVHSYLCCPARPENLPHPVPSHPPPAARFASAPRGHACASGKDIPRRTPPGYASPAADKTSSITEGAARTRRSAAHPSHAYLCLAQLRRRRRAHPLPAARSVPGFDLPDGPSPGHPLHTLPTAPRRRSVPEHWFQRALIPGPCRHGHCLPSEYYTKYSRERNAQAAWRIPLIFMSPVHSRPSLLPFSAPSPSAPCPLSLSPRSRSPTTYPRGSSPVHAAPRALPAWCISCLLVVRSAHTAQRVCFVYVSTCPQLRIMICHASRCLRSRVFSKRQHVHSAGCYRDIPP